MSRLSTFLAEIEPVPDRIDRLVDKAVNTFAWPLAEFAHGDEYTEWLSQFYCHLECTVLGVLSRHPHACIDLSRTFSLLKKHYGENAPQAVFDIARSGSEGGLRQIMRTMAALYGDEYARGLIGVAVGYFLMHCAPSALLREAREYVALHPDMVPAELSEGTPARIMANFRKVLEQHPFLMKRIRETGQ